MHQIWLDDTKYCVVDVEDYEWALQWKWHAMANASGTKFYATRMTRVQGKQVRLWLHKEVLKRTGKRKNSKHHSIGDHGDGDSLNNRRYNLTWATTKMNNAPRRQRKLLEQKGYLLDAVQ